MKTRENHIYEVGMINGCMYKFYVRNYDLHIIKECHTQGKQYMTVLGAEAHAPKEENGVLVPFIIYSIREMVENGELEGLFDEV